MGDYLSTLPEVDTARLPRGTLFVAEGIIFQVTETGGGGFSKARQWRKGENTEVALIPGSFPSKYLRVVKKGRVLPVYRSRSELAGENGPLCFVFPTEMFALDAAYLDVSLVLSPGAYVRNHNHEPAFAVTDGVHIFRLYYYRMSAQGTPTILTPPTGSDLLTFNKGPAYWQFLPGYTQLPEIDLDVTRPATVKRDLMPSPLNIMKTQEAPRLSILPPEPPRNADDTIPHFRS
jgi:hypothetical protein